MFEMVNNLLGESNHRNARVRPMFACNSLKRIALLNRVGASRVAIRRCSFASSDHQRESRDEENSETCFQKSD